MAQMKVYLWRAWSEKRERICDCGTVNAKTESEARRFAMMIAGGPHHHLIVEFALEEVVFPEDDDRPIKEITPF